MEYSKEKQIEEMVRDITLFKEKVIINRYGNAVGIKRLFFFEGEIAERLYNAGYRKASEVALEVIKKVEQTLTVKIIGFEEDFFHGTAAHWDGIRKECYEEMLVELAELKKKYTEEGNGTNN